LGPGFPALGEIKEKGQLYQQQLARLIAGLLGKDFDKWKALPAISLR
jgi:hypothetical protein